MDFVPGTKLRYSGGGVTIEQLLMMDLSGKPFPVLLRETVLDKIGMADSSYEHVYGKAMDESKRAAHGKVVRLVLPSRVA